MNLLANEIYVQTVNQTRLPSQIAHRHNKQIPWYGKCQVSWGTGGKRVATPSRALMA